MVGENDEKTVEARIVWPLALLLLGSSRRDRTCVAARHLPKSPALPSTPVEEKGSSLLRTSRTVTIVIFLLFFLSRILISFAVAQDTPLKTRAEVTDYEETSTYKDVMSFITQLQQRNPLMRIEVFGHSLEGRPLPLLILSDPPVSSPVEARESGKPVVFIMANIHAGEVEGKEAVQHLARRLLTDDLRPLLSKVIILLAPIYNADGNERISVTNRMSQNGPIGGVGVRENAQALDLNRDYIKLDAPESQALVRLFNRWDPHLTMDLHTTDGSYHGYHLTYSIPLNPSIDPNIEAYHRDKLMPALRKAMQGNHKFRTYYYGNFSTPAALKKQPYSLNGNEHGTAPDKIWVAFTPQPRIGQNYLGFRNRLTILSEAYSYLDFRGRVAVTEAFVEETFRYSAAHAKEIMELTQHADRQAVINCLNGPLPQIGVEYEPEALPKPVEVLVGEITKIKNPRSGNEMKAMVEDKINPVKMLDYGKFEATRRISIGRAYLFAREEYLHVVLDKPAAHGIVVEELTAPLTIEVERFKIGEIHKNTRAFHGHREIKLSGEYQPQPVTYPEGTLLVRTAQPLGILAAYLLEPESDDGLVTWNFLDACIETGKPYPITRVMGDIKPACRIVEP